MADFYDDQEERSRIKALIVVDYFRSWSNIMAKHSERLGYFDFFAGPGRYKTGDPSTPILILERVIESANLRSRILAVFNDANPRITAALKREINVLPDIDGLTYKPVVIDEEISDQQLSEFEGYTFPTLSFIDPWGYKGLSLRLLRAVTSNWGCDVIFFFNYDRINRDITTNMVEPRMEAIFGRDRLASLKDNLVGLSPGEREKLIKRYLGDAVESIGVPLLIPFTFRRGSRISHYICFATKDKRGYGIMKEIMANKGAVDEDGVPLFEYVPHSAGRQLSFDRVRPLLALPGDLLNEFAGQTLTMPEIFDRHNVGTPFIKPNYRKVVIEIGGA